MSSKPLPLAANPSAPPFITAVGRVFLTTPELECPPIDLFFGSGTPPYTLFTVNTTLVTSLPVPINSPALLSKFADTPGHNIALILVGNKPLGSNYSFLVADAEGRTALSQSYLLEEAVPGVCKAPPINTWWIVLWIMLGLSALFFWALHPGKKTEKALLRLAAQIRGDAVELKLEEGAASDGGEEEQGQGETSTLLPPAYHALEAGEPVVGLSKARAGADVDRGLGELV